MSQQIAKQLLIRWAYDNDLKTVRPATREFVYAIDTNKTYMGTPEGPKELAYTDEVETQTKALLKEYKIKMGSTTEFTSSLLPLQLGFNTDLHRIQMINPLTNVTKNLAYTTDLLLKEQTVIKVADSHIDKDDNKSITLTDFVRPVIMVYVNGVLAIPDDGASHKYEYDADKKELKIYNMSDGDLVSYF